MVHYLSDYVILFFAYATLGWCMETLYMGVRERRITNRGFLLGPCCPIYGAGMVGITLLVPATKSAAPRLSVMAFKVQAKVRIRIAGTIALKP